MICCCAPMFKFFCTPPDGAGTEYQISNREFYDFLHTYYCDFLNNVNHKKNQSEHCTKFVAPKRDTITFKMTTGFLNNAYCIRYSEK